MSESINLQKQVYDKRQYTQVIDTSFKELGVQTIQERIAEQPTTEEFFALYNELFYNISELGETNSHEYLIKTSSEYINFEANQEEIAALQAEIAQLRTDLLNAQRQIVELQTGTSPSNSSNTTFTSEGNSTSGGSSTGGGGSSTGGGGGY